MRCLQILSVEADKRCTAHAVHLGQNIYEVRIVILHAHLQIQLHMSRLCNLAFDYAFFHLLLHELAHLHLAVVSVALHDQNVWMYM